MCDVDVLFQSSGDAVKRSFTVSDCLLMLPLPLPVSCFFVLLLPAGLGQRGRASRVSRTVR